MEANDLESYGVNGNKKCQMLYKRIVAYVAILLTMLAFIFSCVGLNMARQVEEILVCYK